MNRWLDRSTFFCFSLMYHGDSRIFRVSYKLRSDLLRPMS